MYKYVIKPKVNVLLLFMGLTLTMFAQQPSANQISDSISPNQFKHSLSISNNLQDMKEIQCSHFQLENQDSIEVFSGNYRFEDMDPSAFSTFSTDSQYIYIGMGMFESGQYFTKLTFIKNDESITTLFVN